MSAVFTDPCQICGEHEQPRVVLWLIQTRYDNHACCSRSLALVRRRPAHRPHRPRPAPLRGQDLRPLGQPPPRLRGAPGPGPGQARLPPLRLAPRRASGISSSRSASPSAASWASVCSRTRRAPLALSADTSRRSPAWASRIWRASRRRSSSRGARSRRPSGRCMVLGGGFLVGFGARWAGGCTCGHAISGLADLQVPSLVAVARLLRRRPVVTHVLLPLLLA